MRRPCTRYLALALAATPLSLAAPGTPPSASPPASAPRDGSHDFDWDIGVWRTHQRRRLHPLTGSNTWVEYQGTDIVKKLWDGANNDQEPYKGKEILVQFAISDVTADSCRFEQTLLSLVRTRGRWRVTAA